MTSFHSFLFLLPALAFLFSSYSVGATNVGNQFKWRIKAGTKASVTCRVDYAIACTFFIDDPNGISENSNCSPVETQAASMGRTSLPEPGEDKGYIIQSTSFHGAYFNQMDGELCCAGTPIIAVTSANDENVDTCFDSVKFYPSEEDVSRCRCKLEDGSLCISSTMVNVYNNFDSLEDLRENSSCAPSQSPTGQTTSVSSYPATSRTCTRSILLIFTILAAL